MVKLKTWKAGVFKIVWTCTCDCICNMYSELEQSECELASRLRHINEIKMFDDAAAGYRDMFVDVIDVCRLKVPAGSHINTSVFLWPNIVD